MYNNYAEKKTVISILDSCKNLSTIDQTVQLLKQNTLIILNFKLYSFFLTIELIMKCFWKTNMTNELNGFKVAILATDGFEQSEMEKPKKALEEAGAIAHLISPTAESVKGWKDKNWGDKFKTDLTLEKAKAQDYDALVLPGGVMNPDQLRIHPQAINFIMDFVKNDKPIAAICHGPWTLIDAQGVKGKTMTSWPSIKLDLINAGANWVDREVVRDGKLVTSRKPDDLPAFNSEMIKLFSESKNARGAL